MDDSGLPTHPQSGSIEVTAPSVDLQQLIVKFRQRLPLIAAVALLVLSVVVIFTFQQTPRYTATSEVVFDTQKQNVVDIRAVMEGIPADSTALDTEVQILKSRALADRVATSEKLDADPEFNAALKPQSALGRLLSFGRATAPMAADTHDPATLLRQHQNVVDKTLAGLAVKRVGLTYVVQLAYTSTSPAKAARLANAFAKDYLLQQLDAKFDATRQANDWLNTKVADLRNQVTEAENAVQQYKVANNLMSAQGTTLTETEISTLDSQLATAKEQEAEQEARLQTAKSQMARGSTGEDVGEAMSSPVVQQLRAQRTILTQKIADLQGRYGDRHPELLKANRELADIDAQIKQEIQRIISSLEAQAQVARQRAASIAGSVAQSKGSLAGNDRASVKLDELQRNADAAKALYDSFLARFKETTAQQGLEQNDARIVSQAKIPTEASYPKKSTNFAIGLMLAIAAGLGAAVLADALDSGLATAEDVERELDIPYLGAIPAAASTLDTPKGREMSKTSAIDLVVENPLSSFAESFRNLRASLLYSRVGETVKVILVTSSLPGEGKTTTSIALARTMALAGSQVVVVDCDLRQRSLIRVLPGEPKAGLLEVLNGTVSLGEALIKDEASGAMILPLVRSAYTPKDVFGTAAMKSLMDVLRQHFDIVILDTAPVLPIADTRVLASTADVVVLLVRWRKTPNKAAQAALRLLTSVNAYVAGAALTQVDLRAQARYGYGDPGYYYQSYKKYYGQ